jgi:hypothetical protein
MPEGSVSDAECTFCYEVMPVVEPLSSTQKKNDSNTISSLTITYQFKDRKLEIPAVGQTILGRSHFGSILFSDILYNDDPVISRKHCSIEFKNGIFYLKDEGSHNGTFYGLNKINCENAQQIEDRGIFYLGREPFVATFNYTVVQQTVQGQEMALEEKNEITSYRCSTCGYEYEQYSKTCPNCKSYKKLDPIFA